MNWFNVNEYATCQVNLEESRANLEGSWNWLIEHFNNMVWKVHGVAWNLHAIEFVLPWSHLTKGVLPTHSHCMCPNLSHRIIDFKVEIAPVYMVKGGVRSRLLPWCHKQDWQRLQFLRISLLSIWDLKVEGLTYEFLFKPNNRKCDTSWWFPCSSLWAHASYWDTTLEFEATWQRVTLFVCCPRINADLFYFEKIPHFLFI